MAAADEIIKVTRERPVLLLELHHLISDLFGCLLESKLQEEYFKVGLVQWQRLSWPPGRLRYEDL